MEARCRPNNEGQERDFIFSSQTVPTADYTQMRTPREAALSATVCPFLRNIHVIGERERGDTYTERWAKRHRPKRYINSQMEIQRP